MSRQINTLGDHNTSLPASVRIAARVLYPVSAFACQEKGQKTAIKVLDNMHWVGKTQSSMSLGYQIKWLKLKESQEIHYDTENPDSQRLNI